MKLIDIKESILNPGDTDFKIRQLVEEIKKDCKPYLDSIDHDIDSHILWRGIKRDFAYKLINVRKDRKPSGEFKVDYHDRVNDYLEQRFHIRYRSEAVFATGDSHQAEGYGHLYAIFPVGEFNFIWNDKIFDLPCVIDDRVFDYKDAHEIWQGDHLDKDTYNAIVDKTMAEGTWHDVDMKGAINQHHEIMIACEKYYAISDKYYEKFSYLFDLDNN